MKENIYLIKNENGKVTEYLDDKLIFEGEYPKGMEREKNIILKVN